MLPAAGVGHDDDDDDGGGGGGGGGHDDDDDDDGGGGLVVVCHLLRLLSGVSFKTSNWKRKLKLDLLVCTAFFHFLLNLNVKL